MTLPRCIYRLPPLIPLTPKSGLKTILMLDVIMGDYQNNRQLGKVFTNWFIYNFCNRQQMVMLQALNPCFSPLKQIGRLQYRNGVQELYPDASLISYSVHLIRGNGPVTAITGNLSIYNYKMYIFNENGFLWLSCLKDTSPLITTRVTACPGDREHVLCLS